MRDDAWYVLDDKWFMMGVRWWMMHKRWYMVNDGDLVWPQLIWDMDYLKIGGWGVRTEWPQPGNRFVSFVRASGRGEAKLRDQILLLGLFWGKSVPAAAAPARPETEPRVVDPLSVKFHIKTNEKPPLSSTTTVKTNSLHPQPRKTNVKSTLFIHNPVKPMKNQYFSSTT